jgi:hypothetical protein
MDEEESMIVNDTVYSYLEDEESYNLEESQIKKSYRNMHSRRNTHNSSLIMTKKMLKRERQINRQ